MRMLKMSKLHVIGVALLCVSLAPFTVMAGDFDGSKPLYCAMNDVVECVALGKCQEVAPESVNFPDFLKIDFTKKIITATREGDKRTSTIENMERVDGKLIVQGAEDGIEGVRDGLGWSIAISETTGNMTIATAGEDTALVVFGTCTPQ